MNNGETLVNSEDWLRQYKNRTDDDYYYTRFDFPSGQVFNSIQKYAATIKDDMLGLVDLSSKNKNVRYIPSSLSDKCISVCDDVMVHMLEFTQRLEWINDQGIDATFIERQLSPYVEIMKQLPKLATEHKQQLSIAIFNQGINAEIASASLDQLHYLSSLLSVTLHLGNANSVKDGFSNEEKKKIRISLIEFNNNINKEFHPDEVVAKDIQDKLDNIQAALDKMSRDQWKQLAFSTFISIATGLFVNAVSALPIFSVITGLLPSAVPLLKNKS